MNGLIWVGQAALAIVFLTAGTFNLFAFTPLMQAVGSRFHFHVDMEPRRARVFGLLEVLLAFGVLLPDIYTADGVVPEYVIVRSCAACLAALMVGAAVRHIRRKEPAALDVALFLLALFVIVGRWPF
jgi:hypothetical protein